MNKRVGLFSGRNLFTLVFLWLQIFLMAKPGLAANYRDVSSSLNSAFSGSQLLSPKNVIGTVLTIFFFILVFLFFRFSLVKKEKQASQKGRVRIRTRPLSGGQQKRNWFRLRTNAEFRWIAAGKASRAKEDQYDRDSLIDLSGGGLCFKTVKKLNPGEEIKILLDMGGDKKLYLTGRVLRTQEIIPGEEFFKVSTQFVNLSGSERDRVVSFIMKHQLGAAREKKEDKPPQ